MICICCGQEIVLDATGIGYLHVCPGRVTSTPVNPPLRLLPFPSEWEAVKAENAKLLELLAHQQAEKSSLILQVDEYRKVLQGIAKGEGSYSRDHLEHASNTIEAMKQLAKGALGLTEKREEGSPKPYAGYKDERVDLT